MRELESVSTDQICIAFEIYLFYNVLLSGSNKIHDESNQTFNLDI